MEEKKRINSNYCILIIILFAVVCFFVSFVVFNELKKNKNGDNNLPVIEDKKEDDTSVNDTKSNIDDSLDDIIITDDMNDVDSDVVDEIVSIMEKYYTTVAFSIHCGEKDYDDIYYPYDKHNDFIRCLEYNSISELKQYYDSFLSSNFYSKMLEANFVDYDNKLYCRAHHTAPYTYEAGSFEVVGAKESENSINAIGVYKTEDNGLYPSYTYDVIMSFIYSDGHLVLDELIEKMK